jgi:hypothetical protein
MMSLSFPNLLSCGLNKLHGETMNLVDATNHLKTNRSKAFLPFNVLTKSISNGMSVITGSVLTIFRTADFFISIPLMILKGSVAITRFVLSIKTSSKPYDKLPGIQDCAFKAISVLKQLEGVVFSVVAPVIGSETNALRQRSLGLCDEFESEKMRKEQLFQTMNAFISVQSEIKDRIANGVNLKYERHDQELNVHLDEPVVDGKPSENESHDQELNVHLDEPVVDGKPRENDRTKIFKALLKMNDIFSDISMAEFEEAGMPKKGITKKVTKKPEPLEKPETQPAEIFKLRMIYKRKEIYSSKPYTKLAKQLKEKLTELRSKVSGREFKEAAKAPTIKLLQPFWKNQMNVVIAEIGYCATKKALSLKTEYCNPDHSKFVAIPSKTYPEKYINYPRPEITREVQLINSRMNEIEKIDEELSKETNKNLVNLQLSEFEETIKKGKEAVEKKERLIQLRGPRNELNDENERNEDCRDENGLNDDYGNESYTVDDEPIVQRGDNIYSEFNPPISEKEERPNETGAAERGDNSEDINRNASFSGYTPEKEDKVPDSSLNKSQPSDDEDLEHQRLDSTSSSGSDSEDSLII